MRHQLLEERLRHDGILEERSGAVRILIAGNDQHGLAVADFPYRCADFHQSRIAGMRRKELLQVGVTNTRLTTVLQRERYLQDDVTIAIRRVEDAGAIGETALRVREDSKLESLPVENSHLTNGLRDLLAIGADVLRSEQRR